MSIDADLVRAGLARVHDEIAGAGGDPAAITIVAVTKGFGVEAPRAALEAGLVDLGENYAQELQDKVAVLAGGPADGGLVEGGTEPRWHFIGRLQSNKVRLVADLVSCWQSVDRASVVDEIAKRAPGARVLIQVNSTDEAHKGGAEPGDVPDLVARARDAGLDVAGLMAVGVAGDDAVTEAAFARTAGLADRLDLPERSMGMSADLGPAVRSGTTMIRVGTALFGPRPPRTGTG